MKVEVVAYGQDNKNTKPESRADELDYIARMSEELSRMAARCDKKFIAYLLSMVSLAAREENMHNPCANDRRAGGSKKD